MTIDKKQIENVARAIAEVSTPKWRPKNIVYANGLKLFGIIQCAEIKSNDC